MLKALLVKVWPAEMPVSQLPEAMPLYVISTTPALAAEVAMSAKATTEAQRMVLMFRDVLQQKCERERNVTGFL